MDLSGARYVDWWIGGESSVGVGKQQKVTCDVLNRSVLIITITLLFFETRQAISINK